VSLFQGVIELGAFFELRAAKDILLQQLLGCLAAFGAHRINFKNQPRSATDWQTNKSFILSHGISIANAPFFTIWRAADMRVSVRLTPRVL